LCNSFVGNVSAFDGGFNVKLLMSFSGCKCMSVNCLFRVARMNRYLQSAAAALFCSDDVTKSRRHDAVWSVSGHREDPVHSLGTLMSTEILVSIPL